MGKQCQPRAHVSGVVGGRGTSAALLVTLVEQQHGSKKTRAPARVQFYTYCTRQQAHMGAAVPTRGEAEGGRNRKRKQKNTR